MLVCQVAEGQLSVTPSNAHLHVLNGRPDSGISGRSSKTSLAAEASLLIGRKLSHSEDLSPFNTRKPIRQLDYSAFVRKCPFGVKPKLLDAEELRKREEKALEEFNHFRSVREAVKEARERNRQARNRAKMIQLETAEEIQVRYTVGEQRLAMQQAGRRADTQETLYLFPSSLRVGRFFSDCLWTLLSAVDFSERLCCSCLLFLEPEETLYPFVISRSCLLL